jgi:hypothetical protein
MRQEKWVSRPFMTLARSSFDICSPNIQPNCSQSLSTVTLMAPTQLALVEVYGDEFRDLAAFDKRFQTLIR